MIQLPAVCRFRTIFLKIRSLIVCGVALALVASGRAQSAGSGALGPIDEGDAVTLTGNTHPLARAEFDRGVVAPETRLERLVMLLQPDEDRQRQLDELTEAQQRPGSAGYRRWLTPEQYGSRFGASPEDVARVAGWLGSHGFTVEPVGPSRRLLIFSGTEAEVEDAFHTEIHRYRVDGENHIGNSQDPQIPRALARVVAGIVSLHDFRRRSEIAGKLSVPELKGKQAISPENTQPNGAHYLFPADFAAIYDLNPLYAAGTTGKGSYIAVVGRSNISLNDIWNFRAFAGLSTAVMPTVVLDGPDPGLVPGDQDEATLDVEWAGAVAPAAAVRLVAAASTATTDGVDLAAQYAVNHRSAQVMSTSFGSCEAEMGKTELAFYNSLWQQAASEGISAFVSSGDSGAAGCDPGSAARGTATAVNGMCTSPYATCVGGTEFVEGSGKYWAGGNGAGGGSALGYIPEKVWNESGADAGSGLWSSGGGASTAHAQPGWQQEIGGANSETMRAVPDVALSAALHDGYLVRENGNFYIFGGTSASSPAFAGMMALVVQQQGRVSQGCANPGLYGLLLANSNPFHATPAGNNAVPGVSGFAAGASPYNLATGLGSVDGHLLVTEWSQNTTGTIPGFTLTASVPNLALLAGQSAKFAVNVGAVAAYAQAVKLAASAPAGVTVTLSGASAAPGQAIAVTAGVAASVKPGAYAIVLQGSSGPLVDELTIPLTVQAPATMTVSAPRVAAELIQGKTASLAVTVTTGGAFAGPVALTVTGLPKGVTAAWSKNNFAAGAGSSAVTLTLSAAKSATLGAGNLTILATGDGLKAQAAETVQVVP